MSIEWKKKLDEVQMKSLQEIFEVDKPVIGMIHLAPLPGAPGYNYYEMDAIIEKALTDVKAFEEGGVNGLIVENMWDHPYYVGEEVPPEEMTAQAVAAREIIKSTDLPTGINVIHNGGRVTLSIAVASGADFIRVCLLTGARVWDTGEFDHGCAAEVLRLRKNLGAEHIKIFADVDKKHSVAFPGIDLVTHIQWTKRYLADAIIVTGKLTGIPPKLEDARKAKEAAGDTPVLVGSGASIDNVKNFLKYADGVIVGTSIKKDGVIENPVDTDRVKKFIQTVEEVRGG
ncbi:MAG: BtpA/SgcQ family protein [Candidatus Hadarchaeota archaeon]|nr:BtpA/SgcQ family protein [Candidatus Hadarchaeota archaeon]